MKINARVAAGVGVFAAILLIGSIGFVAVEGPSMAVREVKGTFGNTQAQYELAEIYLSGNGAKKSHTDGIAWLKKAANRDHFKAQYMLAEVRLKGEDAADKNPSEGLGWLKRAAVHGDPNVQVELGGYLLRGGPIDSKDINPREAAIWFTKAAEQGNAVAQYELGSLYVSGVGVPQDAAQGCKWLKKAAEQHHIEAAYSLGSMMKDGRGVPEEPNEAFKWLKVAADQHHLMSEYLLAGMLLEGKGCNINEGDAFVWLTKAAEAGLVEAQRDLAKYYLEGEHTKKDPVAAVKLYQLLSEKGDTEAMLVLGDCCKNGIGVSKSQFAAIRWYRAALSKTNDARDRLNVINPMWERDAAMQDFFDSMRNIALTGSIPGGYSAEEMQYSNTFRHTDGTVEISIVQSKVHPEEKPTVIVHMKKWIKVNDTTALKHWAEMFKYLLEEHVVKYGGTVEIENFSTKESTVPGTGAVRNFPYVSLGTKESTLFVSMQINTGYWTSSSGNEDGDINFTFRRH